MDTQQNKDVPAGQWIPAYAGMTEEKWGPTG